jgi:hypothetical protein
MKQKLEVISRAVAEKLEAHANVLHTLIAAQRRGAAEQFGYAFLAGRALLQAKAIVPNGNAGAPNAGFKNWVAANLPEITMRTAENWMLFAESVIARAQVDAIKAPLWLGSVEISGSAHESILQLVPEIMDGKGMMRFMRDSRLLRRCRRSRNSQGRDDRAQDLAREKRGRAGRIWSRLLLELEKGRSVLADLDDIEELDRYLNALDVTVRQVRRAIELRTISYAGAKQKNSFCVRPAQGEPPRQNHQSAKSNAREEIRHRASVEPPRNCKHESQD